MPVNSRQPVGEEERELFDPLEAEPGGNHAGRYEHGDYPEHGQRFFALEGAEER